ncbi:cysteine proteinase inhibitor 2-like [Neltuma alba]|uniref:cysteine proteinase inhibitor 2-like n=1 Tax=Neltuma alba TaxID=207710 RepID=UPI0010A587A1|nr:cysteine proteinase inhibitor 2-like [Prosopis alba]
MRHAVSVTLLYIYPTSSPLLPSPRRKINKHILKAFFDMVFTMLNSPAVTLATFVTVLLVLVTASDGRVMMVGEKTDMGDVRRNKEVQELGRFSVDEYNERVGVNGVLGGRKKKVEFMKVVEAKKQVVVGTKYYLKIWAVDEKGRYREFDSVVEVKPWLTQNAKQLLSFAPSHTKRDQKVNDDEDDDVLSDESVLNKKLVSSM